MKKIIINANPWQTRVALTQNGLLQNVYFSSQASETLERSFFKGSVIKVLPGIQTAFVDIGKEKAGFLHISEVDHDLALQRMSETTQMDEDAPQPRRQALDIKNVFKEGDPVLVQVSKEPVYEKGAKLTTCFTLPGRFVVLMPNIPRIGVSKKIEEWEERNRLKDIVRQALPEGMGAIIRTTCEGRDAKSIAKDINFLVTRWHAIQRAFASAKPAEKIHEDLELSLQVVRDHLDDDVEAVITDDLESQRNLYNFIKTIAPEYTYKVVLYEGAQTVFAHFGIDKQLDQALEKKVELASGGSLIIETAEAMTVIDVNSGGFTGRSNMEETILQINLEAAQEVVRQLRLRNIGGLIVIDFIDMASAANRQKLFNVFEKALRERDKFQSVVLKVSEFGLVQMTRKRSGLTLVQQLTDDCTTCGGSGFVTSLQEECFTILRLIKQELQAHPSQSNPAVIAVSPAIFDQITTIEYNAILQLEKQFERKVELVAKKGFRIDQFSIEKS